MDAAHHLLGQAFALGAAITWATALVLFKRSGEQIPPVALNMYKNAVGLGLLLLTLAVLIALGRESFDILRNMPTADLCLLLLSGIVGIALADTILFASLNLIGVGLMAVVDCTYSPLCILIAWLMLAETLTPWHYLGAALIVSGVFIASRHAPPAGRTRSQILVGIALAILAIALMAVGIVVPKPILEEYSFLWTTTIRMAAGSVGLALFALLGRNWRRHWVVFRPSATWRYAFPAAFLGTYLSMTFWVAGFTYTYASVASVLNQTSVIFASLLAAWFLKERFGPRKIIALVLGVIGVLLVMVGEDVTDLWRRFLFPPTV